MNLTLAVAGHLRPEKTARVVGLLDLQGSVASEPLLESLLVLLSRLVGQMVVVL